MTTRRAFLGTLVGGLLVTGLAAEAQQAGKVVRIGLLSFAASDPASAARWKALRERLRELGYVEGQNVAFEARWGDGQAGRLRGLAAQLIDAKVELVACLAACAASLPAVPPLSFAGYNLQVVGAPTVRQVSGPC